MDPIKQPLELFMSDGIDSILNKLSITDIMIMRILNKWWKTRMDIYASACDIGNAIRLESRPLDCLSLARIHRSIKSIFSIHPQPAFHGTTSSIKFTSEMLAANGIISLQFALQYINGTINKHPIKNPMDVTDQNSEIIPLASQFPCWFNENSSVLLQEPNLQLTHIPLYTLPSEILTLTNLQTLHFLGNLSLQFPAEICALVSLSCLSCVNGEFSKLPAEIGNLTNLEVLNFNSGHLETLPPQIRLLTELKRLFLSDNRLSALPSEISHLTNLGVLELSCNDLEVFPLEILSLTQLGILSLHRNKLESMPWDIDALINLRSLSINNNKLSWLPPTIRNLQMCQVAYNDNCEFVDWMGRMLTTKYY